MIRFDIVSNKFQDAEEEGGLLLVLSPGGLVPAAAAVRPQALPPAAPDSHPEGWNAAGARGAGGGRGRCWSGGKESGERRETIFVVLNRT